jgi:cytochrome o ubiquinol oxidase subunit 1
LAAPLLHHGFGASVNAFFGLATMLISIPTGVKLFNWLFTIYQGRLRFTSQVCGPWASW